MSFEISSMSEGFATRGAHYLRLGVMQGQVVVVVPFPHKAFAADLTDVSIRAGVVVHVL